MALFPCTKCGCIETICVRTRTKTGETLRQRRCVLCGHVMETTETVTNPDPAIKKRTRKPKGALEKALGGEK